MWHINSIHRKWVLAVISAGLFCGAAGAASPQAKPGDPARWYKADRTYAERVATSKKEAHAAYQEALVECRRLDRQDRTSCVDQAKAQLKRDLDYAQRQPEPVASLGGSDEAISASAVRRQIAMLMLDEMECDTR